MKPLVDFDCLQLVPRGAPDDVAMRIKAVFPLAIQARASKIEEILVAAGRLEGAYVLVLPDFITPRPSLSMVRPDPILLDAGYRLGWMSRNAVTGEIVAYPGPELWRRSAYIAKLENILLGRTKDKANSNKLAVMPDCQADWAHNTSSGAAFNAGMAHVKRLRAARLPKKDLNRQLTIAATIGQDAQYCDWWQLGVMCTILGAENQHQTFYREKELTAEPGDMLRRINDLLRHLRLEAGLDVHFMSEKNSRFFKKSKFLMPPRNTFEDLAEIYADLGAAGLVYQKRYVEASEWIWAHA